MVTDLVSPRMLSLYQEGGGDDLLSLQEAGEPEGLIWAESDLKLHFCFSEFLDCKYFHNGAQTCRPEEGIFKC